jgi:hypothetical protein
MDVSNLMTAVQSMVTNLQAETPSGGASTDDGEAAQGMSALTIEDMTKISKTIARDLQPPS